MLDTIFHTKTMKYLYKSRENRIVITCARKVSFDIEKRRYKIYRERNRVMEKAGFRIDQLRGDHGQWALEDATSNHPKILDIAYNGRYHDQLVHELAENLRKRGGVVIEGFKITAYNGMTAIADALVRNNLGQLYILEVKTGQDPTFTLKQSFVYPYVCFGNHAISSQSNITELGFVPGRPLPKMPVIIYESLKPGVERLKGDICTLYQ